MRFLFIIFFCFCYQFGTSQSLYEVKWKAGGIDYTALIEFFEKENIKVRVKYNLADGTFKVAKYTCIGQYVETEEGDLVFLFDGSDAQIVYSSRETNYGYSADNFFFVDFDEGAESGRLAVIDDQSLEEDKLDNMHPATYRKLNPKEDFSETYINSFFAKSEPEFKLYTDLISRNYYKLKLHNECNKPVRTLIRFKNLEGTWETKGWWTIEPGTTAYVEDSKDGVFYLYAESTDKSLFWRGNVTENYRGQAYKFLRREKNNSEYGSWVTNLTCESNNYEANNDENVKLHVLMAADTYDPGIGKSVGQDMDDITNLFQKAARELNIQYDIKKVYGDTFDKNNIVKQLNSWNIKPNDVIVFYYSGHGYNNVNRSNKFPSMSLDGEDLDLSELHRVIQGKGARLTITIGDMCNSIPRSREGTRSEESIPFKSGFLFDEDKLRTLFVDSRGSLISASSQKGEWSFCMSNANGTLGNGHFTNAFINSFTKEVSKVNTTRSSWSTLFSRAYSEAKTKTNYQLNQNGRYGQSGFNESTIK